MNQTDPPPPSDLPASGAAVVIPAISPALRVQQQSKDPSIAATTTFQEDLTTAGQRQVNLIWESTQGNIALFVIVGTMLTDGIVVLTSMILGHDLTAAQALALGFVNSLSTGVVSFYFSRTNHTQIGGTGNKPNEEYKGR
jgi:hypothetical protein